MSCTAEQPAATAAVEEEGFFSGMLSRKHQWESTTKKASSRLVITGALRFDLNLCCPSVPVLFKSDSSIGKLATPPSRCPSQTYHLELQFGVATVC